MNPEFWSEMGPELFPAFWVIIKLTIVSVVGSLISSMLLTAMCVSPVGIPRTLSTWYINIVHNTPLTLIVLLALMGLYHNLGLLLTAENDSFIVKQNFRLAVLAFAAYTSRFIVESLRAGIDTMPLGRAEAVCSLDLSFGQSFRYIISPQTSRGAIVPLGNILIALTKNTTIVSAIGVAGALLPMKTMTENYASDILIISGIIAIDFIILALSTGLFFGWASKRWAVKR